MPSYLEFHICCHLSSYLASKFPPVDSHTWLPNQSKGHDHNSSAIDNLLVVVQRERNDPTVGNFTGAVKVWVHIVHVNFNFPFK